MRVGYNTNGFGFHRLDAALEILGELGYQGVAITVDNHALNPWGSGLKQSIATTADALKRFGMGCVLETGARFLLDPRRKHEPTLVSAEASGRRRRLDFLTRVLDIGAELGAEALSFWSGVKPPGIDDDAAWCWLVEGCRRLAAAADKVRIPLAFEPEPGMFIENLEQFRRLKSQVAHPAFGLTLDVGHAFLTEPVSPADCVRRWADDIHTIHLEDMRRDEHRHLFFGQGEMAFEEIFDSLRSVGFKGLVNIELSRHSHDAVATARRALAWVAPLAWSLRSHGPAAQGPSGQDYVTS